MAGSAYREHLPPPNHAPLILVPGPHVPLACPHDSALTMAPRARRSILHPPGEDQFGYEASGERWLPIHSVESILVSVISSKSWMPACPSPPRSARLDARLSPDSTVASRVYTASMVACVQQGDWGREAVSHPSSPFLPATFYVAVAPASLSAHLTLCVCAFCSDRLAQRRVTCQLGCRQDVARAAG